MILFINHERHLFVVAQIVFRYGPVFDQVRADQMLFHQHAALDTVYIAHQKAAVVVFLSCMAPYICSATENASSSSARLGKRWSLHFLPAVRASLRPHLLHAFRRASAIWALLRSPFQGIAQFFDLIAQDGCRFVVFQQNELLQFFFFRWICPDLLLISRKSSGTSPVWAVAPCVMRRDSFACS